jgi:branched-chain amino acid transport system substrate-binding protein
MKHNRQNGMNTKYLTLTRRKVLATGAAAVTLGVAGPFKIVAPALAQSSALKIGVLAPLSGGFASLGNNKLNGIKMFFAEKGQKVAGRTIELAVEDTEFKPEAGLRKARKLVEQDNVDILLGVLSSAIGYALKQYVVRAKKVWVTTGAAADGIFKKANNTPYAFRASLSTWQANEPMGTWLAEKGFKRVFVTGSDYAMGREAVDAFDSTFKLKGGTRAGEVFAPLGTTDFAPYLPAIKNANPDIVYATYAGSDAVRFVQQYSAFGLKKALRLAGYGYLVEEDVLKAQGASAEGVNSGLNWGYGLDTPANKTFVTNFRKQFNAVPTDDSVAGYVGAQVVWEAFNKLGGRAPSSEALSDAILATKIDTPRGPISFDPETRNVIQNIYIREVVKDGNEFHNKVLATYPSVRDPGV